MKEPIFSTWGDRIAATRRDDIGSRRCPSYSDRVSPIPELLQSSSKWLLPPDHLLVHRLQYYLRGIEHGKGMRC
jgi:hypothetical protein